MNRTMAEGSPGFPMENFRFTKRSRPSEDLNVENAVEPDPLSAPVPGVEAGLNTSPNLKSGSFRDKLMNKVKMVKNAGIAVESLILDYEDLNDVEDVVISRGDRGPSIQFSDRAMNRLCQPWKNSLIIKLLGRSHTYNYIHDRLQQKWSLKGNWKLVDLVNDFYVVRFDLEEDLNYVLTEGPWIIAGQYLTLQKWKQGFCPTTAHITRMAAWIRVSAIQLECFDVWALKRIGSTLGKLLKIDALTTSQNRGKFARLCVELDLSKPLDAFIQINQTWYNIEYEGLPDICYLCGHYGHKRENCRLKEKPTADVTGEHGSGQGKVNSDTAMGAEHSEKDVENLRGPWMNVPPRRKPKNGLKNSDGQTFAPKNQGSRFDVLGNMGENSGTDTAKDDGPITRTQGAARSVFEYNEKVWTKSKTPKAGARTALKEISNNHMASSSKGAHFNQQNVSVMDVTQAGVLNKGKIVSSGKSLSKLRPASDSVTIGGSDQNVPQENDGFIFGHQPPNIDLEDDALAGAIKPNINNEVSLTSSDPNDFYQVEGMDLSEGQDHFFDAAGTVITSILAGGKTSDL